MTEASEAHAHSGETPNPSEPEPQQHAGQDAGAARQAGDAPGSSPGGGEASASSAGSEPEPAQAGEPERTAAADASTGEAATGGAPAGDADQPEAAQTEAGEAEAAPGADGGVKRKRRRRKKGKGKGEAGEQDAASAGGEPAEARRKRESSMAPFQRFFSAPQAGRKHGFAVDEAVAGRVTVVAGGTVTIDLFGKAVAFADEHEPRDVPVREAAPAAQEPSADPAASQEHAGESGSAAASEEGADVAANASEASADATILAPQDAASSEADSAARVSQAETEAEPVQQEADTASSDAAATPVERDAQVVNTEAANAQAVSEGAAAASGDQPSFEHEHAGVDASADDADAEMDGEATLSGEASPVGHGPLPPAPVVPDDLPRLEPPKVGQVFRGRVGAVSESGHIAIINRYIDRKAVLANLERYRAQRRRVQGLVYGFNRGGFDVLVEGARAFCPASTMALEDIEDPTQYLGQKLEFLLPASQVVAKDIIVSRRSILERQQRKKARELVRALEPGQKLKGRVTQVREFGLFVDIGGIEGLVHQSELSFAHGAKPGDVAQAGDEVEVQVLRVGAEPTKRESGKRDRVARVSLSMKALQPDPWDAHADVLKEGSAQLGKITRTTDFGAFVEVAPQIEGLLHITELGRDLKHANQAVNEGDELQVVIERVDRRARRISLSKLSQQELEELQSGALGGEEGPRSVRPGSRIKVKVARVEARGLVVRISGVLGKRARGYVPSIELPGGRGGDLRKSYPVGMELDVKVVGIDRDGGLRCSPKALAIDEERKAVKDYRREASKQGFGTFGDLLRAKLGQGDSDQ